MGEVIDSIENLVINGLMSENPKHKQFYLEEILRVVCNAPEAQALYEMYEWEEGVEP